LEKRIKYQRPGIGKPGRCLCRIPTRGTVRRAISSSGTGQPVAAQLASVISGSIQAPARSSCALASISAPWTPAAVAGDLLSLAQLTARTVRAGDLQRQHGAVHGRAAGVGDLRQHPGTGPELPRPGVDLRALDARSRGR